MSTITSGKTEAATSSSTPGRSPRLLRYALWGLLLLAMGGMIAFKLLVPRQTPSDLPEMFPAAQFALTDQDGRPFTTADLRGHTWIADFIFTHCGDICPRMTATMADLQKQLPRGVQFVSFSVDPDADTPAVLRQYGTAYHADFSRWHFLTGPRAKALRAVDDMKIGFSPAERNAPIKHSGKMLLIDSAGNVRGDYESNDPASLKRLVIDAKALDDDARHGRVSQTPAPSAEPFVSDEPAPLRAATTAPAEPRP